MKKFAAFIAILLCTGFYQAFSQPVFRFEKGDTVNWGQVKYSSDPVTAKVKITNPGTDTLKIYRVKPGCSCTAAPMDKNALAPGDSAFVNISLNVPNIPGPVHKYINFATSDPDHREVTLHLEADILFPFRYFPNQYFGFANMVTGREYTSKIIITNTTDHDIIIKDVRTEPANFKVNLKNNDVIRSGKEFELTATARPESLGPFQATLKFKTTDPDLPHVEIQARGMVEGTLQQTGGK